MATDEGNIYSDILDSENSDKESSLKQSMYVASKTQPDAAAQDQIISQQTKIPADVVSRNKSVIQNQSSVDGLDYGYLIDKNPGLSKWLQDPANASVGHDDIDSLGKHENTVKEYSVLNSFWRSLNSGVASGNAMLFRVPALAFDVAMLPGNNLQKLVGRGDKQVRSPDWLRNNPAAKYYDAQAEAWKVPEMDKSIIEQAGKGDYAGAGKSLFAQLVANAPQQAFILASGVLGKPMLGLGYAGVTQAAGSNKIAQESGVDPVAATTDAIAQGSLEALFEKAGTFGVLKRWENAIAKSIGKQSSKLVMKEVGKTILYSGLAEGNEEFLTSASQDFADYVTGVNPDGLKGILVRAIDAGLIGAGSGMSMTAPTAIGSGINKGHQLKEAERAKNFYLSLGGSAEASKLRERMPDSYKSYVNGIVKDSPVENIYIPVDAWDMYMQSKGVDPSSSANEVGITDEYNHAKETGKDIQIPLATWANKVVGTEHYQGLADDIKFDQNGQTVREIKTEEENVKAEIAKVDEQAKAAASSEIMTPEAQKIITEQADQVSSKVAEQLKATGRFSDKDIKHLSSIWGSFSRVFGGRMGFTPEQFFNKNPLSVKTSSDIQSNSNQTEMNQDASSFNIGDQVDYQEPGGKFYSGRIKSIKGNMATIYNDAAKKSYKVNLTLASKKKTYNQFAGPESKTAVLGSLDIANTAEQFGKSPEAIRQETGWFRGADGKWRYEISDQDILVRDIFTAREVADNALAVRQQKLQRANKGRSLSDLMAEGNTEAKAISEEREANGMGREFLLPEVYNHPVLFEAYPQLKDIKVRFVERDGSSSASFNPKENVIELHERTDQIRMTQSLVHEIQHAIQEIENFARGGSVQQFWLSASQAKELNDKVNELNKKLKESVGKPEYETIINERQIIVDKLIKGSFSGAYDQYAKLAGETEARDSAQRAFMNVEQRKDQQPDVRQDATIVYGGKEFTLTSQKNIFDLDSFKKWFGDSKVVDENGIPKVLYHGSTHVFDAFNLDRANVENHLGKAFYFTDNKTDVSANYVGEGPDLTIRIEQRSERIFQDMFLEKKEPKYGTKSYEKAMNKAREAARKELSGGSPTVYPVYVKMENPLVLDGPKATNFELNYDEETGDETGNGMALYDAVNSVAMDFNVNGQDIWNDVFSKIGDSLSFTAREFDTALRKSEKVLYIEDQDTDALSGNDFIKEVYKAAGFDGIIMNADKEFGSGRKMGKAMAMDEGTHHYIVFDPNNIKSVDNKGTFDPNNPNIYLQSPVFYSQVEKVIEDKMPNAATPEMIRGILSDKNGVKQDELNWIGIDEFLKGKSKVSKQELVDFIRSNQVELKEVIKGGSKFSDIEKAFADKGLEIQQDMGGDILMFENGVEIQAWELEEEYPDLYELIINYEDKTEGKKATKFASYQLPGGDSYREILLTLPPSTRRSVLKKTGKLEAYGEAKKHDFKSPHFDEPNILVHIRINERIDADGKKVLFVEEVQSDWHQKGRKSGYNNKETKDKIKKLEQEEKQLESERDAIIREYTDTGNLIKARMSMTQEARDKERAISLRLAEIVSEKPTSAVPDAPFKKTWHELAMKRMLRYAAENGYDRLAWTTGEQQAERYDLSKQLSKVEYEWGHNKLRAEDKNGNTVLSETVSPENIEEYVGKEVAKQIIEQKDNGAGEKYVVRNPERGNQIVDVYSDENKVKNLIDDVPHLKYKKEVVRNISVVSGIDLKVGGEGMKGFYDTMLPAFMNKYAKKWGGRVQETRISTDKKPSSSRIASEGKNYWVEQRWIGEDGEITYKKISPNFDSYIKADDFRIVDRQGEAAHSIDITPSMRDSVMSGQAMFQNNGNPLGAIIFGKEGGFDMRLLKDMNYSTFLHETGHAFLEMMRRSAVIPDAPADIQDMSEKTLKWLGIDSWDQLERKHHEQFAQGFEKYLFEGVAPSEGLRAAFARFRVWLVSIYKSLQGLNVQLSNDIRSVMDRMLATDQEIADARAEQGMDPMIQDPVSILGEAGGKRYIEAINESRQEAEATLQLKLMEDYQRARKSWWMEELKNIYSQVAKDVNVRPEHIAISILQRGKMPDGTPVPSNMEGLKISSKDLIGFYSNKYDLDITATDTDVLSAEFDVEQLEGTLKDIEQFRSDVRKVKKYDDGYLAEELAKMPKRYVTKNKYANTLDQAASEMGYEGDMALLDRMIENEIAYKNVSEELTIARKKLRSVNKQARDLKYQSIKTAMSGLPRGITREDGSSVHVVAQLFGYSSADQFLDILSRTPKRNELIKQVSIDIMVDRHGQIYGDKQEMHEQAMQAIHGDKREQLLRMELEYLASKHLPVLKDLIKTVSYRIPTSQIVKKYAADIVGKSNVGQISAYQYQLAERRSAKAAGVALSQGKFDEAFEHKRKELLNFELYRAATAAREDIKKTLSDFKKIAKSDAQIAKSRDLDYVNAARSILAKYGIGEGSEDPYQFIKNTQAYDPDTFEVISSLIDSASEGSGDYLGISYNQFSNVKEAINAIWEIAKRSRQIQIDGQKMEIDEVRKNLIDRIHVMTKKPNKGAYEKGATENDKFIRAIMGAVAQGRRVESWVDVMDGGDSKGWFTRSIWNPVIEGTQRFRIENRNYTQKFLDLIKPIEKSLVNKEIVSDELRYVFQGKAELLGALLHTGNESNLSKLLRGRGWGMYSEDGVLDTSRWDMFIKRMQESGVLTKQDYDFLQASWDLFEELKPASQRAHKEMYGHYFNSITAREFVTPWGTYKGGYAPAIADPFVSEDAAIRKEKNDAEQTNNSYMFPTTGRGFTKNRVERKASRLAMDLRLIPQQINKVLRFTYIEPRIKDVARIVRNQEFRDALKDLDPVAGQQMLAPWLQRAAQQIIETPDKSFAGWRVWREIRTKSGINIMAGNVVNTLQQFTGLSIAAVKVQPKYLRNSLWNYMKNPKVAADSVLENSDFMKTRTTTHIIEIQKNIDEIILNQSKYSRAIDFAKQHGYFMQQGTQNIVDMIVWPGAYDQSVANGNTHAQAVRDADAAVRLTQGDFSAENASNIETGNALARAFLMFYSYFNMQANLLGTEFSKVSREMGLKRGAGRAFYVYMLGFMIPAVVSELILKAMSGEPWDKDDDGYLDDSIAMFFGSQFKTATAMFPFVGQVANIAVNKFNNKWYDDDIKSSPAVSMIESASHSPQSVYKAIAEDGSKKTAIRDTLSLLGILTGVPVSPLSKPLGYLSDVSEGKVYPENNFDFTRGLITGKTGK